MLQHTSFMDRRQLVQGLTGIGVEIGVHKGHYSEIILQESSLSHLYSVDPWSDDYLDIPGINQEYCFQQTVARLKPYGQRNTIIRRPSHLAAVQFQDESLDFVYIDGSHHYPNVKLDIECWWPKLKSGGMLAGHDYFWICPGVIQAVDEFVARQKLNLTLTGVGSQDDPLESLCPSWVCYKP